MSDRSTGDSPDQPDPSSDSWSAWLPRLDPPPPPSQSDGAPQPVLPQASAPPPSKPAYAVPPPWAPPVPAAPPAPQGYSPPPSHLLAAVLCTVFCFMPFGIVALVRAISVGPKWAQGRWDDADRASRSAKTWCLLAVLVWPGFGLFLACSAIAGLAGFHR